MHKLIRQVTAAAAIFGAFTLAPPAHATFSATVDFEDPGLTGLYFAGDSFSQHGFTLSVDFDAGIVDTAAALGGSSPTGNPTQFYSQLNDGGLILRSADGSRFNLTSFDAAFVPLSPAALGTTVIVAFATYPDASTSGVAWLFAGSSSSHFPFAHYGNPADFAGLTGLLSVEFFACTFDGVSVCASPTNNNGQFAIDNISGVILPEPSGLAMLPVALLGMALAGRRGARRGKAQPSADSPVDLTVALR